MVDAKRPAMPKPPSAPNASTPSEEPVIEFELPSPDEIRTKLDLARQFLDMGDPDSARHMLDEVISEGDASQQQEATRLLESLP